MYLNIYFLICIVGRSCFGCFAKEVVDFSCAVADILKLVC